MFKSGEVFGKIIKHHPNGMVDIDYLGTIVTLPESENELKESGSDIRPLLAPNGQPSNLPPAQYALVRTPAFKAWFGDWEKLARAPIEDSGIDEVTLARLAKNVSKIVDENGEPMFCWHGTNEEFNEFRDDVGHWHDEGFYGNGFYFTFGNGQYSVSEAAYYGRIVKGYFIQSYTPFDFSILSKYKGKDIRFLGTNSLVFLYNVAKMFPEIANEILLWQNEKRVSISIIPDLIEKYQKHLKLITSTNSDGEKVRNGYLESKTEIVEYDYTSTGGKKGSYERIDFLGECPISYKDAEVEILLIEEAIKRYDGISPDFHPEGYMTRFPQITEAIKRNHDSIMQSRFGDEIVVFKPTQIKLADGTNTTYDGANPDIRLAKGGSTTPLLAPNGKPSNLNEVQYKLVRTPAFKAWFGDWEHSPETASKVVDENGEPRVIYHGTNNDFTIFKKSKYGSVGKGIYFTTYNSIAENHGSKLISVFAKIVSEKDGIIAGHEVVLYKPQNIKLADGTNTTFDVSDPDIRFDKGGSAKRLLAPNGKPSNLNEVQYKLVRTPAFKAWFGDWQLSPETASKVVDENGEPLVVYHGSDSISKIKIFKTVNQHGYDRGCIFFSSAIDEARRYTSKWNNVRPFFLNVRRLFNPKRLLESELIDCRKLLLDKSVINRVILSGGTPKKMLRELMNDPTATDQEILFWVLTESSDNWIILELPIFQKYIKSNYYDAFTTNESQELNIAVFNPTQIKIADGTNTTFDTGNPDIRFSAGGLLAPNGKPSNLNDVQYKLVRTPAFKAWFGDWENDAENSSKVVDENGEPLVLHRGNLVSQEELGHIFNLGQNFLKKQSGNQFGFFFTNSIATAKKYMLVDHFDEIRGGSITSVFIQSNKTLNLLDFDLKIGQDNFLQGLIEKGIVFTNEYNYLEKRILDFIPDNYKGWGYNIFDYFDVFPELRNLFIENGFNSVVFYEMSRAHLKYKVYVAFSPNQIKLADGSNSTFDSGNPDIRFNSGGAVGGDANISKTPAPKSDRVYGSKTNAPKSAESANSAKEIELSDSVVSSIENKLKEHNHKNADKKISLAVGKAVVRRGMGAYSATHRPTISGGSPNSRVAWGLARLNAFIYKVENGNSKSGRYSQDNDLLDDLEIPHLKFENGGDADSIYDKWKSIVNMTAAELEKFYNSEEGKEAGLSREEANELGIHYGRESARWIIKMKKTPVSEWTPTMWEWAKRQINFNTRMLGNKGPLYDDSGRKTRKHTSLLIWGHNPEKYNKGGKMYHVTLKTREENILQKGLLTGQTKNKTAAGVWANEIYGTNPVYVSMHPQKTTSQNLLGKNDVVFAVDVSKLDLVADLPSVINHGAYVTDDTDAFYWRENEEPKSIAKYIDEDGMIYFEDLLNPDLPVTKAIVKLTGSAAILQNIPKEYVQKLTHKSEPMQQIVTCIDRALKGEKPLAHKYKAFIDKGNLFLYHYHHLLLIYDIVHKKAAYTWHETPTDKRGINSAVQYLSHIEHKNVTELAAGGALPKRDIWIRFNLSNDANFGKWKIENKETGKVVYLDPEKVQIVMYNCILTNVAATAKKIFSGEANKSPISYVKCENADILYEVSYKPTQVKWLHYNPHLAPNWFNVKEENIDNTTYPRLITYNRRVYIFNAYNKLENLVRFEHGGEMERGGVVVQRKTFYHGVKKAENVKEIIANGFDLNKINPLWQNDLAVSVLNSPASVTEFFGREMPVLKIEFNGVIVEHGELPGIHAKDAQDYTKQILALGIDAVKIGRHQTFIYNVKAIQKITLGLR